jgi:cell division protein FtsZ
MKKKAKKKPKTIAKVRQEKQEPLIADEVKKTKIRMIGIGGGAGTIVSEIAARLPKATFVVANTDLKSLKTTSRKAVRFHFGQSLTRGLGTGMDAEIGRQAALADKEKIKKLFEGQDLCIFVVCLGGGTGSGAAPVFAKIAKDMNKLTFGIFTLPFKFEGEKKTEIAMEGLRNAKNYLNAFSVIPNERVFQVVSKATPLKQALSTINKSLSKSLEGLIETIYEPGLINIDFADFKTILDGHGKLAYLNTVEVARKKGQEQDLGMNEALNSPFYPYGIRGAKGVLFNIAGEKDLSLSEVNQISKTISDMAYPEAKIIFGIAEGQKYSNIIKTTVLANGCAIKIFSDKTKKKKKQKPVLEKTPAPKPKTEKTVKAPPKKIKKKKPVSPRPETRQKITVQQEEEAVRKNGLQVKKETEEKEKEISDKESFWETPSFLRKNNK